MLDSRKSRKAFLSMSTSRNQSGTRRRLALWLAFFSLSTLKSSSGTGIARKNSHDLKNSRDVTMWQATSDGDTQSRILAKLIKLPSIKTEGLISYYWLTDRTVK